MTPLCTIGYEGFTVEQWVERLRVQRIQVVVDVREMPISRKRGFSKSRLAELLRANGIEYVHLRALGNPKPQRERLKSGWAFEEFAVEFKRSLKDRPDALEQLRSLAADSRVCLVCFEEDPASCHRSIIAESIVPLLPGYEVRHLRYGRA
ncbi:MAG: DUF488 domain-containing protein [Coriobacteriia bacterium]|nr:DUF488 domain-containing protein [Coriobacteriia bacterium]